MAKRNFKTSAYLNYFNDLAMLAMLDSSGQLADYDELVIVDGPYRYNNLMLSGSRAPYLDETPFGRGFLKNHAARIQYRKGEWADEREKRIAAYELCSHEIIVSHDSDEIYAWNEAEFSRFVAGAAGVAYFECQNLCLDGYVFSPEKLAERPLFPRKAFAFKKSRIGPAQHLDYLWLVGVNQQAADPQQNHAAVLADGYHFTQMRDREGQTQKYVFYTALDASRHERPFVKRVAGELGEKLQSGVLNAEEAAEIFLLGLEGFAGLPPAGAGQRLYPRKLLPALEVTLNRTAVARRRFDFRRGYTLLSGYPLIAFLPPDAPPLRCRSLSGPVDFELSETPVYLGEEIPAFSAPLRQRNSSELLLPPWHCAAAVNTPYLGRLLRLCLRVRSEPDKPLPMLRLQLEALS
ncbi:hypothetical protein SAMN04488038_105290 [Solimonas aquatica]|uniref:Uncharacterized protein n=1 Tax=Solimonas aquatica TaxID=489703 RepID=A0A1H9F8I7_9GAMM|nr:hypothetical protein [Solimonas aquatica]SEQ34270.1 hypothetical protein SAMN04488038_105290 [Solimonas aquatica]